MCCLTAGGLRKGDLDTMSEYHSLLRRKKAAERRAAGARAGAARGRPPRPPVPFHFLPIDVSDVPVEVDVLQGRSVCLINRGSHGKVRANGLF